MTMREKGILFGGSFLLFLSLVGIRMVVQERYFCNTRIGFGFFEYSEWFLFLGTSLLIFIGYLLYKSQRFSLRLVFSILLVSSLANIFERVFFGCVLDYVSLPLVGSHINLADILIISALMYAFFFVETKDFKN